ncbi:MAG: M48 family metallopeptidase [Candidatus Acidiferrales bacterium]
MGIDAGQAIASAVQRDAPLREFRTRWLTRAIVTMVALGVAVAARADRTPLKPGTDIFSPRDDIEIGLRSSRQAEAQLPMLNDPRVDNYLDALGKRLAAHAPGYPFPYQFRCVNDESVNAFALPGGFIYVDRGAIEAAHDEAQLAGVLAHEIAHVALRHGTHQATKAYWTELPFAAASTLFGGMSGVAEELGSGFAVDSILLKYSRTAETQADILGTQIVYDSGYDPRALAQFFEMFADDADHTHRVAFFENHPNPDHRIDRIDREVELLGGPSANYQTTSDEFQEIRRYLRAMPAPPEPQRKRKSPGTGAALGPLAVSTRSSGQSSGAK